jgi:hypothetical protein
MTIPSASANNKIQYTRMRPAIRPNRHRRLRAPRTDNAAEQRDELAPLNWSRSVAAILKAHSIPEGGDQVRTRAAQDFGRDFVCCGSMLLKKSQTARRQFACCKKIWPTTTDSAWPQSRYRGRQRVFSSSSEVPHIFTRKSRVQPKEILITSAKRLFQQHRSKPAVTGTSALRPVTLDEQT